MFHLLTEPAVCISLCLAVNAVKSEGKMLISPQKIRNRQANGFSCTGVQTMNADLVPVRVDGARKLFPLGLFNSSQQGLFMR